MDSPNQSVSKILEALTPALSAELDRVAQEARQQQEEEFKQRLESAVKEAESSAVNLAQSQTEQAVTEAREKVSAELQAEFEQKLQQTAEQMRGEFAAQTQTAEAQWTAEKAQLNQDKTQLESEKAQLESEKTQLQEQAAEWRTYAQAQAQLFDSNSQAEILSRFLSLAEPFASSLAVYVTKGDGLSLWKTRGKAAFPDLVSKNTIDPEFFFKPVVVRDKTLAAVCARQPCKTDALDVLSASLGRAIELFGLRLQTPAPRAAAAGNASKAAAAAASSGPTDKLAADARQAARLLVSEIKLYNEQDVNAGRASSDLYARLKKQIDQGREQYRQRVNSGSLSQDYYHEELVRVLANGETSRMGSKYPGPMTS